MQQHQVDAKIIVEIPNVEMHRLIGNQRTSFTSGTLRICELPKSPVERVYFLNLNSFYYTISSDNTFVKVVYPKSISYVYVHFDTGLVSITIPLGEPNTAALEETLRNTAVLVTYEQAQENPILAATLKQHAANLKTVEIGNPDKIQQLINTTGQYAQIGLKWLGGFIGSNVNKLGQYLDQKIENKNEIKLSQDTKQKWNEIKQGTGRLLTVSGAFLSSVLDPVITKGKEVVNQVNTKIDSSSNTTVKYAKEIGSTTVNALGQAFTGLTEAAVEVGSSVSKNAVHLWEKKYGDDVPKTLFNGNAPTETVSSPANPAPQQPQPQQDAGLREDINLDKTQHQPLLKPNPYPDLDEKFS